LSIHCFALYSKFLAPFMQINREQAEIELSHWLRELGVRWDGQLDNIETLELISKHLDSLPDAIGILTNLQELHLRHNRFSKLPESIVRLTNLQILDLGNNQLNSIPESINRLTSLNELSLWETQLTSLPESIAQLTNLQRLYLSSDRLTILPETIARLTNLREFSLRHSQLSSIPEWIGQLTNLELLSVWGNQLTNIPETIARLTNLQRLDLGNNPLTDLSPLQKLNPLDLTVRCFGIDLPPRYWMKFSEWHPEWLLDEDNAEIRRIFIQQVGYERICNRLGAEMLDIWREYTLLKINNFQPVFDDPLAVFMGRGSSSREPIILLKMTCSSTGNIHILRVPPEMESAEAAINWVNHGIHPDDFAIQT
jgi:leucine-rich repeat protein SHOC2